MRIDSDIDFTDKLVQIDKCNNVDHEGDLKCICHLIGQKFVLHCRTPYGYQVIDDNKNMFVVHPTEFSLVEEEIKVVE